MKKLSGKVRELQKWDLKATLFQKSAFHEVISIII